MTRLRPRYAVAAPGVVLAVAAGVGLAWSGGPAIVPISRRPERAR